MSLLVVGLNHRTAPLRLLERAAIGSTELKDLLHELLGGEHIAEAVALSTCNRVEVYAEVSAFHGALNEIGQTLSVRTNLHLAKLADHLYIHYADDAVRHVFGVASGLDSLVVGEAQILGQLRDAYAASKEVGGPGRLLHELMQQALRVGKRVHTDTGITRAGQSVVSAALRLGEARVGSLAGRPAAVIGAGSMGALAASSLQRLGIGHITVLNRTPARAKRIAASVEGRAGGLDELPAMLREADVVVTATGASAAVVTHEAVTAALPARGGRPLLVLDLGLPRDTERRVDNLPGVTVLDIEALATALASEPASADIDAAHAIVAIEVETFLGWQRSTEVAPTVVALRARAEEVVASELARLHTRLPELPPKSLGELERTVRRVVSTLLHLPTVRMQELASAPGGDRYAAAVRELFLLDVAHAPAREAVEVEVPGAEDHAAVGVPRVDASAAVGVGVPRVDASAAVGVGVPRVDASAAVGVGVPRVDAPAPNGVGVAPADDGEAP